MATSNKISVTLSSQIRLLVDDETVVWNISVNSEEFLVCDGTSLETEWTGEIIVDDGDDDDDDGLISSSIGLFEGIIERFNGWIEDIDEWRRFAGGNWLGEDDFRDSGKIDDDLAVCSDDLTISLGEDDDDDVCFDIAFWRICSRFLPAAVVLYLKI